MRSLRDMARADMVRVQEEHSSQWQAPDVDDPPGSSEAEADIGVTTPIEIRRPHLISLDY